MLAALRFAQRTAGCGLAAIKPTAPMASVRATAGGASGSRVAHLLRALQPQLWARGFAVRTEFDLEGHPEYVKRLRNIGISAHIDSGKTTLTERVLFYTGRINAIHEVRGRDGVGAKMDSMELEREKGITIQSAATYCKWGDYRINIIDTPGHVDFTVEVERALRVLDGAVLVLCGVAGVQSQSITVDRQMKRYNVPRVAFINKLDRQGANPWKVVKQLQDNLKLNAVPMQVPIGLEQYVEGVVDLVSMKALYNRGEHGDVIEEADIPANLLGEAKAKRQVLLEKLAEVDDEIMELFVMEEEPTQEQLLAALRRATIGLRIVPVFMGSAFKNRGVQALLDGVVRYLPSPPEVPAVALDVANGEQPVPLECDVTKPTVALAFKLEDGKYGQLTYMRIYQGRLARGDTVMNIKTGKKVKVPRVVRMHADEMEEIDGAGAGEILAMFGVDCASGDTFTDGTSLAMSSMFVPDPVMSLAVAPKGSGTNPAFSKALARFSKEDPTFRVSQDPETRQTVISGMGELHLEIYVERMLREFGVECVVGQPKVNFRETIQQRANFDYLHKKQSGGAGQYGRVVGYVEPLEEQGSGHAFEFENGIIGNAIPPEYILAVEKGFREGLQKGWLTGHPIQGVRAVLTDGAAHAVDSSELAFKTAAIYAFRQGFMKANPTLLEPIMNVEITVPTEFQGVAIASINRRKGLVLDSQPVDTLTTVIRAEVPLSSMFGYSTDLRSGTQGKGEFTMEYKEHARVPKQEVDRLVAEYQKSGGNKIQE